MSASDFLNVLEKHALKEVLPTLTRPTTSFEAEIPNEDSVAYADDVDFIGQNYAGSKKIQEVLRKIPA